MQPKKRGEGFNNEVFNEERMTTTQEALKAAEEAIQQLLKEHDAGSEQWALEALAIIREAREGDDLGQRLISAIDSCKDDTWQCPKCGHSETWWTESNAHYLSCYPDDPHAPQSKEQVTG